MSQSTIKRKRSALRQELSRFTVGLHNVDDVIRGIVKREQDPEFLIIDLFCGAGGTSTGFEMAGKVAKVIACVNHDPLAIQSHWINHPEVAHFSEDIRTLDLEPLRQLVAFYRKIYPKAKIILWASLECTNFSKAKGGQPRDADSRTLAEHLHRYIQALNPDYIQIENVVEFMSWGPLNEHGKPVSKRSGADWLAWCESIKAYGYNEQWTELNSANFGAFTSRNRLFGCFAKKGLPIVWPEPTHSKKADRNASLFDRPLAPWKPVREVLDLDDQGTSIFNRKKPLVDATLNRIYEGLVKFVAGGKESFMVKWNSLNKNGQYAAPSIDDPCPTIPCQSRLGLAFITKYYSAKPLDHTKAFIGSYYGTGTNVTSIDVPAPTLPTKDRCAVYSLSFLDKQYNGGRNQSQSIERPAGTIMQNDKHCLVTGIPFVMRTSFGNSPTSVDEPCPTLLASRRHHIIVNPSHGGHSTSVDAPGPVIIARQDKSPLYLVEATEGNYRIPIYDSDSEIMVKIKEFMAMYGLVDIKMRMLKVAELLRIQGFPDKYVLIGTQSDQKKFIGNSVVPLVVQRWAEALAKCQPSNYITQPLKLKIAA